MPCHLNFLSTSSLTLRLPLSSSSTVAIRAFSSTACDHLRLSMSPTTTAPANNSYASQLRQCSSSKSIIETRRVHLEMIKSGFPYLSLGNKLIDAYVKCGLGDDARQVFDVMFNPHIVSWNNIISSYVRNHRSEEAIRLYQVMPVYGVFPDEYTFSIIFKAFADVGQLFEARRAHGRVLVLGVDSTNPIVGSALVDMYAKYGGLVEARMVFDRVIEKDVILYTAMIVGYMQNDQGKAAVLVYGDMILDGCVRGNEYTFSSVLIACGNSAQLWTGLQIHGSTVKSGFQSRTASQTSLMIMYSKFSMVDESLKIFNEMKKPNAVTFTAVMGALANNHREEHALLMFRDMIRGSIDPNEYTLSTCLRACSALALLVTGKQIHSHSIKNRWEGDSFVGAALVDMYGKCGSINMSRLVFDNLKKIDVVSVNSLIYGYAQNGDGREAVKLFDQLQISGLKPNEATYTSVLSACSSSGLLEEGRKIFLSISNHFEAGPSNDHYACLVDLLGRAGKLEEAESIITTEIKNPDAVILRSFLSACKIHGCVEMAERAARRILELDPSDYGTHVLLSNIYATTGKWSEVIEMKKLMREMKLKKEPALSWVELDNREVHTLMAGDTTHPMKREIYEELEALIKKTKILGYVPDTRSVLQDMSEIEKERSLYYHSEKLAIAFAVCNYDSMKRNSRIMIFKNLRVCRDCHNWIKLVTKAIDREITARDAKRFHHFKDGLCSCGDYW